MPAGEGGDAAGGPRRPSPVPPLRSQLVLEPSQNVKEGTVVHWSPHRTWGIVQLDADLRDLTSPTFPIPHPSGGGLRTGVPGSSRFNMPDESYSFCHAIATIKEQEEYSPTTRKTKSVTIVPALVPGDRVSFRVMPQPAQPFYADDCGRDGRCWLEDGRPRSCPAATSSVARLDLEGEAAGAEQGLPRTPRDDEEDLQWDHRFLWRKPPVGEERMLSEKIGFVMIEGEESLKDMLGNAMNRHQFTNTLSRPNSPVLEALGPHLLLLALCWHMRKLDCEERGRSASLPASMSLAKSLRKAVRRTLTGAKLCVWIEASKGTQEVHIDVKEVMSGSLLKHLIDRSDDGRDQPEAKPSAAGATSGLAEFRDTERRDQAEACRCLLLLVIDELNKLWRRLRPDEVVTADPVTGRLISVDEFCKEEAEGALELAVERGLSDVVKRMVLRPDGTPGGLRAMSADEVWPDFSTPAACTNYSMSKRPEDDDFVSVADTNETVPTPQTCRFPDAAGPDMLQWFQYRGRDLWMAGCRHDEEGPLFLRYLEDCGLSLTPRLLLREEYRAVQGGTCREEMDELPEADAESSELADEVRADAEYRRDHGMGEAWTCGRGPNSSSEILVAPLMPPGWEGFTKGRGTLNCYAEDGYERHWQWAGESLRFYRIRRRRMVLRDLLFGQAAEPKYDRFGLFPTPLQKACKPISLEMQVGATAAERWSKIGIRLLGDAVSHVEPDSAAHKGGIPVGAVIDRVTFYNQKGERIVRLWGELDESILSQRVSPQHSQRGSAPAPTGNRFDKVVEDHADAEVTVYFKSFKWWRGALGQILQRAPWTVFNRNLEDCLTNMIGTYAGVEDDDLNVSEALRMKRMLVDLSQPYCHQFEPVWMPRYVRITRRLGWRPEAGGDIPGREEDWCLSQLQMLDWFVMLRPARLMMLAARIRNTIADAGTEESEGASTSLVARSQQPFCVTSSLHLHCSGAGAAPPPEDDVAAKNAYLALPRDSTYHPTLYLAAYAGTLRRRLLQQSGVSNEELEKLLLAINPGVEAPYMNIRLGSQYLSALGEPVSGVPPSAVGTTFNSYVYSSIAAQTWQVWRESSQTPHFVIISVESCFDRLVRQSSVEGRGPAGDSAVLAGVRTSNGVEIRLVRRTPQGYFLELCDSHEPFGGDGPRWREIEADVYASWDLEVHSSGEDPVYHMRLTGTRQQVRYLGTGAEQTGLLPAGWDQVMLTRFTKGAHWNIPGLTHESEPVEVAAGFGHRHTLFTMLDRFVDRNPVRWRGDVSHFGFWAGDAHDVALLLQHRLETHEEVDGRKSDHLAAVEQIVDDLHLGELPGTEWVHRKLVRKVYRVGLMQAVPFVILLFLVTVLGFALKDPMSFWAHTSIRDVAVGAEYPPGHEFVPSPHWMENLEDIGEVNVLKSWFSTAFMSKVLRGWEKPQVVGGVTERGHGGEGGAPYPTGPYGAWFLVGSVRVGQLYAPDDSCEFTNEDHGKWLRDNAGQYKCFESGRYMFSPGFLDPDQFRSEPTEQRYPIKGYATNSRGRQLLLHPDDLVYSTHGGRQTITSPNLETLSNTSWINPATRLVSVQFVHYNPSTGLFVVSEIYFEILGTGNVVPSHLFTPVSLSRSVELQVAWPLLLSVGLWLGLMELRDVIFIMMDEVNKGLHPHWDCSDGVVTCLLGWFYRFVNFLKTWLMEDWNGYDLIIVAMIFLNVTVIHKELDLRDSIDNVQMLDPSYRAFQEEFLELTRTTQQLNDCFAWLVVLCWFKTPTILRYVRAVGPVVHNIVSIFTVTEVFGFVAVFVIFLLGLVQGWYISTQHHEHDLSTPTKSFLTTFRMVLGDWDMVIDDAVKHRFFSPVILFVFMALFVNVFFLNILIAVISEAYASVRQPGVYEKELSTLYLKMDLLVPRRIPHKRGIAGLCAAFKGGFRKCLMGTWVTTRVCESVEESKWKDPVSFACLMQFKEEALRHSTQVGDIADLQMQALGLLANMEQTTDSQVLHRLEKTLALVKDQGQRLDDIAVELRDTRDTVRKMLHLDVAEGSPAASARSRSPKMRRSPRIGPSVAAR
eukprot:TRINITY_DN8326_c0_g1_i1.p1 TRINITY_DN8326_c0_g1~~TRINITY_DN8326_c0_g1_i1.p1  ORF type:complete len:2064 (+),score=599.54 TRINITY_DN8326_c0_g1_i1:48-6194(+)